jgi:effector-binding domain-containing protein
LNTSTATAYDVTLKTIEPIRVAAIHGVVPSVEQLGDTFDRLFGILEEYVGPNGGPVGPPMALYHDAGTGPRMLDMHVELAIPFNGAAVESEQVRVYELPRVEQMACAVHKGMFEEIGRAYDAVTAWVAEHGYRLARPMRDVYLSCGEGDSPDYITEVQFPVAREP